MDGIISIIRLKNGFHPIFSEINDIENRKFVTYSDVKFNVVVNYQHKSIIGEIQFILSPMVEAKKKLHQLYEVERNEEFFASSFNHMNRLDLEMQIKIALESDNVKNLCNLVILGMFCFLLSVLFCFCCIFRNFLFVFVLFLYFFMLDNSNYIYNNIVADDNFDKSPVITCIRNNCIHNLRFLHYRYGKSIPWRKYNYLIEACKYLTTEESFSWLLSGKIMPQKIIEEQMSNNECLVRCLHFCNYFALKYILKHFQHLINFEFVMPDNKWNLLHYACYFIKDSSIFEWLLTDVFPKNILETKLINQRDKTGKSPILRTFFNPNKEIQRILVKHLEHVINFEIQDEFKITLLHYVCLHSKVKDDMKWFLNEAIPKNILLKLLNKPAGLWPAWKKSNCVPISYSIYFNNQDCIHELLRLFEKELIVTIKDSDGETMFDHAKVKWPEDNHPMRIVFNQLEKSKSKQMK